jgi:hypothetical protein
VDTLSIIVAIYTAFYIIVVLYALGKAIYRDNISPLLKKPDKAPPPE